MTPHTVIHLLDQLESDIRYNTPPDDGQEPFRYTPGTLPVLLSAPHGAAHWRKGRYKDEDEYTAAIVRLLGQRTGAHILYTWARSDSDPNWDRHSPYKETLRQIAGEQDIGFVLDLHGMSNRHKFGVAVGTMRGRSCPEQMGLVIDTLQQQGFRPISAQEARAFSTLQWDRYVVDHKRFAGGLTNHTVTRFASEELRIASVQLELCSSLRAARRLSRSRSSAEGAAAIAHIIRTLELLVAALAESVSAASQIS
ncbi:MAG: hypothetical protein R3C44_17230 [Chloroflexota bacterium]